MNPIRKLGSYCYIEQLFSILMRDNEPARDVPEETLANALDGRVPELCR